MNFFPAVLGKNTLLNSKLKVLICKMPETITFIQIAIILLIMLQKITMIKSSKRIIINYVYW